MGRLGYVVKERYSRGPQPEPVWPNRSRFFVGFATDVLKYNCLERNILLNKYFYY
jgi:hypothetical protein